MASEFSSSSSALQPFANPQHAPVPAASHPTSPPTKQSLKSWWKGFRPPTKSHDLPGKYLSRRSPKQNKYFFSDSLSGVPIGTQFQESPMNATAPVIDGLPSEYASPASSVCETSNKRFSFQGFLYKRTSIRRPGSVLVNTSSNPRLQQHKSAPTPVNGVKQRYPSIKRNRFGRSRTFTADNNSVTSPLLGAGILPSPRFTPLSSLFNNFTFSRSSFTSSEHSAKKKITAEQPTGIFGVPLRQSITYANVAISLVDAEGKSYIYGYVPIVVAKCGVYLKEKGWCCFNCVS